jgi:hypothetical protein
MLPYRAFMRNHQLGSVMASVFALSQVDCGFNPLSDQTKDYNSGICCFSARHAI